MNDQEPPQGGTNSGRQGIHPNIIVALITAFSTILIGIIGVVSSGHLKDVIDMIQSITGQSSSDKNSATPNDGAIPSNRDDKIGELYYTKGLADKSAEHPSLNDWNNAIEDFNKAIDSNYKYAEVYYNRGLAYKGLAQDSEDNKEWRKTC